MAYRCCDTDFKRKDEFLGHIRSKGLHFLTSSDNIDLNVNRDIASKIVRNPHLLFTTSGKVSIIRNKGNEIRAVVVRNDAGDRISFGKVIGPTFDGQFFTYVLKVNGNPAQYRLSFRLATRGDKTSLTILNRMEVDVGILGRSLPWLVPRLAKGPARFANTINDILKSSLNELQYVMKSTLTEEEK